MNLFLMDVLSPPSLRPSAEGSGQALTFPFEGERTSPLPPLKGRARVGVERRSSPHLETASALRVGLAEPFPVGDLLHRLSRRTLALGALGVVAEGQNRN